MLSNGYILVLIWVGVIAALAVMAPEMVYRTEVVNGEKVRRVTPLFAVVAVAPLVIWAGFRGNVGDTGSYVMAFQDMPSSFQRAYQHFSLHRDNRSFRLQQPRGIPEYRL